MPTKLLLPRASSKKVTEFSFFTDFYFFLFFFSFFFFFFFFFLKDEAIRRGICLCSEGLIQRTQGINRGQYHCSARSCDRKRLWNYNANHSELPPLPPIQTNITQMCNRQKLRILNDSKRSKQIKEKKQYDKIRRMNSDDADEYLSKYKDHNGNWMSWVYLCAKIAKNNKTDYTPDGHPMYLYLDQEHSLISNRKLKQGIATLSFISWTFTNSRMKYTNMNSLLCNAMLHINTIKRYERLLEVVPGELYVPSLTLHYEKLIGSLFVAAGGGSAFNKNRELDLIQIRKNYTEDLTDTAATTYAHNQKLVLIGHCIEDYLYDRETIKELPKIERVTPEIVEECVKIAKEVIDFFRLAKAEIAAKPKNVWSPQFVDETLEPVWEMLTKHTGFTHTCLQTFFLQMGGMDAVTTKGNIAQVGKNGKVLGSFTDREKGTFPDVYQDQSEMCTHYQLWCLTNMMSGVRTVVCMNPQTSTSEQAVLTSMLMKIDNETFMQMGSMARVEIQCGDRLANNPHSTKRGSLEVMSNEETDNSMKIHDSVQAAMAHYESGASFPDPTDLNNATWFDKATKAAATPPPPNSSSSSSSSSSTQPPLPPTDFRALNLTFNEDVDAAIDRGDIRLQGLFPNLPFMQKVDNLIDTMFDDEISTSEKLISLGLKLKNTNYAKTKNNSIENTNSDNGNIESDMDDDDDVTMVDTDTSVPIPADYGESDNEENKGEGEGDDLNPLLTYDANGDKVDPSNPLEEDDDTLMEEEEEIEKEKDEDKDKEEEEEEEETANPKKHNGDPITAIHVDKLNKTNLKKSLSHFSLSKFNAKRYSDEFRRKKLKNIISKQYAIKVGGDKADARKQIYHFLTKNSPNPTDADVSIRFADRVAFLACGPHLGKCGHALMIRGETKNFPVLMYMHDNDFEGLVGRLKKEVAEYPAKEQARLETKLWQEHKDSQDPVNKGRGGKKRKRTKTPAVEAAEKSADDKFLTKRRKVLKNLLDTKIKKEENQRKKRHLQLKHLTFSHIGRDIIDRAFKIKAAMTKLYTDPCPKLVAADALNQSYLKMDVMRVTRFAACHGFFLALAKGIWDGKPIPYKAMGITPPTPSERYSFLGMSKYASLINTIFVECLMSYRLASFETLEAAESAAGELLVWHLQFDPDLSRDACFGTCFTRYQLEGLFGMLRSFRRLLTMARTARQSWEAHNQCTAPYFLFGIKFGRLCNSYIEGRFSIFRCSVGNASMDGVSITGQFKSMMAREMRGMVRLGIERKQYGGLRAATEQMNRDEDMKTE